ncbi:MAG: formylmethanofuran dehydrogenase [Deltaproteobacteria bacterium]|nr:formylmethanofuran dehydrogenase [Deltaproteobacteria bacterium]
MNKLIGDKSIPADLKRCVIFHGHLCPGLVYGYRVAKEAIRLLGLTRAADEEVVAISENDSCAVDGLQALLGTTAGKGNLILKDYGKNAYTVFSRSGRKAYRFARKEYYDFKGEAKEEFERLDRAFAAGEASNAKLRRQKRLKAMDLLSRPFEEIYQTTEVPYEEPSYAELARSEPCALCGEMTMATKMVQAADGRMLCIPCSMKES